MNDAKYSSRRIFKSQSTNQNVIRELLQLMFLSELLDPSDEIWFVSPWVSDVVLLDNRTANFDSINPEWCGREVRLADVVLHLLSIGSRIVVVTRSDPHNKRFLGKLENRVCESAVNDNLHLIIRDELHTKGILTKCGLLLGSMNITYYGMELNDEYVEYNTDQEQIAKADLEFQTYLDVGGM